MLQKGTHRCAPYQIFFPPFLRIYGVLLIEVANGHIVVAQPFEVAANNWIIAKLKDWHIGYFPV